MTNSEYDPHVHPLAAILRRVSILDDAVAARLKELCPPAAPPAPVETAEPTPMQAALNAVAAVPARKPRTIRRPAAKPILDMKVKRDDGAFTRAWIAAQAKAKQGVSQHA